MEIHSNKEVPFQMKFLLLRHPEEWTQSGILGHSANLSSIYPPIGLLYIGAALEHDGHKVEIIDFGAEPVSKERLEKCLMTSDAIGISVYTNNYKNAAIIAFELINLKGNHNSALVSLRKTAADKVIAANK